MKKRLLGAVGMMLTGAGMAWGQVSNAPPLPPSGSPAMGQIAQQGTKESSKDEKKVPTQEAAPTYSLTSEYVPAGISEYRSNQPNPSRFWFNTEYLLWWFKSSPVPIPLATMAPDEPDGLPPELDDKQGKLGFPNTTIVLGNQDYKSGAHHGVRFTVGYWLDSDQIIGVEGNYFYLAGRTTSRSVSSDGSGNSLFLTVPFIDNSPNLPAETFAGQNNRENNLKLAEPFDKGGSARLDLFSRLQGAELNGIFNLYEGDALRVSVIGGFRWVQLRESLTFSTFSQGVPDETGVLDESFARTRDEFTTRNNFYAGQLGLRAEYRLGNFNFGITDKVALGCMNQRVDIAGSTETSSEGAPSVFSQGGIFALQSNIGSYTRNRFAVANELTLTAGYEITSWARLSLGYNILTLSNVARPGNQMDRNINGSSITINHDAGEPFVGSSRPTFNFNDSSFWAQGINFGLEFRF